MSKDTGHSRTFGADFRLFNEVLIVAREVGFSEAFWRRLAYEKGLMQRVKELVEQSPAPAQPVSLKLAREILGKDKVISASQTAKFWHKEINSRFPILYAEETLRECAEENARGEADWRLFFYVGTSFYEQLQWYSCGHKDLPCFDGRGGLWWGKPAFGGGGAAYSWVNDSLLPNYYLIDVRGRFANKSWEEQGKLIAQCGRQNVRRCDEFVFSEAIFTIFRAKEERIAENWFHYGKTTFSTAQNQEERHVMVGEFDDNGLRLALHPPDEPNEFTKVCLCRTFDF